MQSENDNGIPGESAQGLGVPSQVALQVELLRLAGIRYLTGNPTQLRELASRGPRTKPRENAPILRPMEGNPSGQKFSDLVRNRQGAFPPEIETQPAKNSVAQTPVEPVAVPVPPQPQRAELPGRMETKAPLGTGGALFSLEQAGEKPEEIEQLDPQVRLEKLELLRQEVARCTRCPALVSERTQTVFGVGPIDPELCVIGEAPGFNEDKLGEPFVGEAGQLLNKMLAACGFDRSQVFICNILRCRPPGNRTPLPDEAQMCNPFLVRTVELVRPKFLCLLGATATRYFLDQSTGVGVLRKRDLMWRGIPVQATYHPAYLLRYPDKKRDAWEDLQRMLARMGKAPPGK